MELLAFVRRVVAWRWTPCVAPVLGSILIALLTLVVVPDEIGGSAGGGPLALRGKHRAPGTSTEPDAATDDGAEPDTTAARHTAGAKARPRMPADAVQGFFHKAQELPVEPVDPTPQAEPPPPPPPAATNTVFVMPETGLAAPPAPVDPGEPGRLPPPNVPLAPLQAEPGQ